MNTNIKNAVGIAAVLALVLGAWEGSVYVRAYAQSIQPSSFRSFGVSAEGKAVGIPDVARFSFSVVTEGDKDIAKLQKENTDKVNKAIAFVKSSGVEEEDVKTEQYSLEPRYQYYSCPEKGGACPPSSIVGYTVRQSVGVKVRDFEKTGDILSGVIAQGANTVSELQFKVDDPTALQDQARAEAIEKAQKRADMIAKAGGFTKGRLLSIDEGNYAPLYPYMSEAKGLGMGGGGPDMMPSPTVQPGSQEVMVNVSLRYEIE